MYGRHRNGLGIDPQTGEGTVIGSNGRKYEIGPGADLSGADLRYAVLAFANLADADLTGANLHKADLTGADLRGAKLRGADLLGVNFTFALVDPEHVPLIEAAQREMISTLRVGGRTPNPGYGHHRGYGRRR